AWGPYARRAPPRLSVLDRVRLDRLRSGPPQSPVAPSAPRNQRRPGPPDACHVRAAAEAGRSTGIEKGDRPVIGIGIVGYGYRGPNLLRNFSEVPGCRVVSVSDLQDARLAKVRSRYPAVKTTTSFDDLIMDPHVDAVVIATPVCPHFDLAMKALRA